MALGGGGPALLHLIRDAANLSCHATVAPGVYMRGLSVRASSVLRASPKHARLREYESGALLAYRWGRARGRDAPSPARASVPTSAPSPFGALSQA